MRVGTGADAGLPAHIALDFRAISLAEGVRAALSTAAIVLLDEWLNWPPVMLAALAAWLTCICDAGGPVRDRVRALLLFGVLGAMVTAGYGLLRGAPIALVVPLASLGIFVASLARVWGQAGLQAGNLLSVILVLALREPLHGLAEAGVAAGLFLAGSLWAVLLTMVIWRLHPNLPARRAVANCYRALGLLSHDLRDVLGHPSPTVTVWERHARMHRRTVREAIEAARAAVLASVRTRGSVRGRAEESWIRIETADQIFGALIGLSSRLEDEPDAAVRDSAGDVLRRLRPVLFLLGEYIVTRAPSRLPRLERAVAAMEAAVDERSTLRPMVTRIVDRVRIAITLAAQDGDLAGIPRDKPLPWQTRLLGPLRANMNLQSATLLHALRVASVSVVAFVITLNWPGRYEHWLTITLLLTMQPFFAVTFTRALERIGGTVLGGAVAAVIALVCTTNLSLAVALFPLTMLALTVRRVSFGLFIACVTPVVVLLSELTEPLHGELALAAMRALFTLIGGGLAILGSVLLWPSWEPGRLNRELQAAIGAHGRYARAELDALLGAAQPAAVEQARRAAGLASNNVEASLQRALLEPHGGTALEPALTIDAALRRMAGRLSALQLDPGEDHERAAWRGWRDWIDEATARLARGEADLPARPPLPPGDRQGEALLRIARQIELAAGAVGRLALMGAA